MGNRDHAGGELRGADHADPGELRDRRQDARHRGSDRADNALAGSFNATRKRETLQGRGAWADEREARLGLFRRLHRYNTRRRRSSLGQRSPLAYGAALATTSTALAQAAWPVAWIPGQGPQPPGHRRPRAARHRPQACVHHRFAAARRGRAGVGDRGGDLLGEAGCGAVDRCIQGGTVGGH
ncbi:integrase core domain-containing protein [Streptomyces kebangsaanensis]|uniref:Integrase core domain-containing protein n=1 Tax=Streptomyces kebangsaanensis TaxID=864058 RepID=A0ABW6L1L0_9ACTN